MTATRKHPLAECEKCPLQNKKCAPTTGPLDAKIALVSRAPGQHDADNGKPFSGPSKDVVDYLLKRNGLARYEVLTTNVVLCQTDDPEPAAIAACRPRLLAEIDNAETIIAAGTEAITALTRKRAVSSARGYSHSRENSKGISQRVVATNNPALVLRNSDSFPDLVTDFKLAIHPPPAVTFPKVEIVNDPDRARSIFADWRQTEFTDPIASDLEWRGTEYVCAGFSIRPQEATVFGLRVIRELGSEIRNHYERKDIQFIWHNGKSDTTVLHHSNIPARVDHDTFLLSYALDEEPGRHALDYLLQSEFGWPDYEPDSVKHFKKTGLFDYYGTDEVSLKRAEMELYEYNGWDAAGTLQLFNLLKHRAIKEGVYEKPYLKYLIPAGETFRTVEMRGFHFDKKESCNILDRDVYPKIHELKKGIQAVAGVPLLNPNSPTQMEVVYYEQMGLRHNLRDSGKKKLSRSTGKEVRKEILEGRARFNVRSKEQIIDLARLHQVFAKIDKQRGTYFEGLVKQVGEDGKLYSHFNLGGTVSGRTSSKGPNFQNITREGVEGISGIRTAFLPSVGNRLVQGDLSQAELRTCAVLSQDRELLAIYRDSSRSLHKERAKLFYGDDYTYEQYVFSKNINFGVTYGQSAVAFAQMYAKPLDEAQALVDSWWKQFPELKAWTYECWKEVQANGYIQSPFGHRRRFHLITADNKNELKREAVNFRPQNIAGWLTICAIIELVDLGVPVISTVHDSIVADVPNDEVNDVARLMQEVMQAQAMKHLGWDLPFLADVSVGDTWGSVEEIEFELQEAA